MTTTNAVSPPSPPQRHPRHSPLLQLLTRRRIASLAILFSLLVLPHHAIDASVQSKGSSSIIMSSSSSSSSSPAYYERIVFSDVDGTLVHYPSSSKRSMGGGDDDDDDDDDDESTTTTTKDDDHALIRLPPSKTGQRGVISARTLTLCHRLRCGMNDDVDVEDDDIDDEDRRRTRRIANGGVPLVLVSGMRTTTLFQRLPYLPRADAYVCESGGRIFYPSPLFDAVTAAGSGSNSKEGKGGDEGGGRRDHDDGGVATVGSLVVRPIYYRGMHSKEIVPFALVEDEIWRERVSRYDAAGPDGYDDCHDRGGAASSSSSSTSSSIDIHERRGRLWDIARCLSGKGYVIDHGGYASSFRINREQQTNEGCIKGLDDYVIAAGRRRRHGRAEEDKRDNYDDDEVLVVGDGGDTDDDGRPSLTIPEDLGCSTNLGCVDVYPAISGKKNCAEYLLRKFLGDGDGDSEEGGAKTTTTAGRRTATLKTHAYCMCDDDNDAEMAMACRAAYLPSVTSESMRALATNRRDGNHSLIIVEDISRGIVETLATEAALEAIIEKVSFDLNG